MGWLLTLIVVDLDQLRSRGVFVSETDARNRPCKGMQPSDNGRRRFSDPLAYDHQVSSERQGRARSKT
jgi:hypothetical protein